MGRAPGRAAGHQLAPGWATGRAGRLPEPEEITTFAELLLAMPVTELIPEVMLLKPATANTTISLPIACIALPTSVHAALRLLRNSFIRSSALRRLWAWRALVAL